MKKKICLFIAAILVITSFAGAFAGVQAVKDLIGSHTMILNSNEKLDDMMHNAYNLQSSDPTIATVQYSSPYIYIQTFDKTGTVTISGRIFRQSKSAEENLLMTLNVGAKAQEGHANIGINQADITKAYSVTGIVVENPDVCSATFANGELIILGKNAGSTNVSFMYQPTSIDKAQALKIRVNVSKEINSGSITVDAGRSIDSSTPIDAIDNVAAANPLICKVEMVNNRMRVTGLSAGTTTIKGRVMRQGTYTYEPYTATVIVNGEVAVPKNIAVNLTSSKIMNSLESYSSIVDLKTSDSTICTAWISGNKITFSPKKAGVCAVSATVTDGYGAREVTYDVSVTTENAPFARNTEPNKGVYLGPRKEYTISAGSSIKPSYIRLNGKMITTTPTEVIWLSSDSNVVSVTKEGLMTAKSKGKANIIAVDRTGRHTDTLFITVK